MSTQLSKALRTQVMDEHRDPDTGLVKCALCGGRFPDTEIQIDHRRPEHLGGGHEKTNLQPLCYPKVGPSCHKDKTATEATARAAVRAKAKRSPLAIPLAVLGLLSAAALGRASWLIWHGQSLAGLQAQVQTTLRWWVIVTLLAGAAYALAHLRPAEEPPAAKVEATGESPAQRITAALREEMGQAGRVLVRQASRDGRAGHVATYQGTGFPDHEDGARLKVQRRLSAKLGGRQQCVWDTEADQVFVSPRPPLPRIVPHPGVRRDPVLPWHQIPISNLVTIDLKVTPHVLVIGTTLAGKTSIFRSAIVSLAPQARAERIRLLLFDPKMVELVGFRGWPGVLNVLTEDEELYEGPGEVVDEMRRRMRLFKDEGVPLSSHQPWIVIIDEYREYVKRMGAWSLKVGKRKTSSSPLEPVENVATLLAMARRMNIHLIIGTQRPDAKWFGGDARDNMQCRIGVGPLSSTAARMLFEDASQGRDIPIEAKGRFTIQANDGEFVEDQSWFVPDPTDADGTNTASDWALLERLGMPTKGSK
jgi:hypothetical protein